MVIDIILFFAGIWLILIIRNAIFPAIKQVKMRRPAETKVITPKDTLAPADQKFAEQMIELGLTHGLILNRETGTEIDLSKVKKPTEPEQAKIYDPMSIDYDAIADNMIKTWKLKDPNDLNNKKAEIDLFVQTYLRARGIDDAVSAGRISLHALEMHVRNILRRNIVRKETAERVYEYRNKRMEYTPNTVKEIPNIPGTPLKPPKISVAHYNAVRDSIIRVNMDK